MLFLGLWLEIYKVLGKSRFNPFWKPAFARCQCRVPHLTSLCPDASCSFLGFTLLWIRCSQADGQTEGTGKRPTTALVSLQGLREDWSAQRVSGAGK